MGLTVSPDRLVQIRRNRLEGLNAARASDYVDHDAVRDETVKARRAFERRGWPTIDVTRRSVEETAAAIINLLSERRGRRRHPRSPHVTTTDGERLILASKSAARRAVLTDAGVPFTVQVADVDEDALKTPGVDPVELAVELARAKALAVSRHDAEAWVLGADQTLAFDGGLVSKAPTLEAARERLIAMRGRTHRLHSGAALARNGQVVWSGVDTVEMRMRGFSDAFLDAYLAAEGEALLACVGSYRLEGLGSQLFEAVEGDYFTVLGLPLWPVLAELRRAGVIVS